jgi:hypothetical protein
MPALPPVEVTPPQDSPVRASVIPANDKMLSVTGRIEAFKARMFVFCSLRFPSYLIPPVNLVNKNPKGVTPASTVNPF